jgi:uncharacterized protein YcbK (DUF882 family)
VDAYAPPSGFIEVTPENQDLQVSTHFRLRNFLTKDQFGVWPKYLALDMRLIDKLELVLQELNAMGVRAENVAVMSGFRTPAYNVQGLEQGVPSSAATPTATRRTCGSTTTATATWTT